MSQAISRAIAEEMRADPTVVLWGEDVGPAGGVFKVTAGLHDEFGDRVRDTPISEMGFLGAAAGAAATGLRPVVEIMFIEFAGVALDQIVTEAALFHYLSAGKYRVPMTIRASAGAGLGFGAQHSQTLERWFIGTPGLKVVVASGARSAYQLTRAAIRDDGPVVVLEPRSLYATREEFDPAAPLPPLGAAELLRAGSDVTVLAAGSTVATALAAADQVEGSMEVIDVRSVWPWDQERILSSLERTGHLVMVEESSRANGWSSAIAAEVASSAFGLLRAPIARVTAPDVPVPFSPPLEARFRPTPAEVAAQVTSLVTDGRVLDPWWVRDGMVP
jgi:pyruvate dehydrogenase E1 component beta subunit